MDKNLSFQKPTTSCHPEPSEGSQTKKEEKKSEQCYDIQSARSSEILRFALDDNFKALFLLSAGST